MKETFQRCLASKEVGLVRADSGFYREDILNYLESENKNYILAARLYPNIKSEIRGASQWITLSKGIELSEMTFSHIDGKPRRLMENQEDTSS